MTETKEAALTRFPRAQLPGETRKQYHRRYIASECWQQVRDAYFSDALNPARCVTCGKWDVDLHHKSYRGLGGNETSKDLVPFCRWHHDLVHELADMFASRGEPSDALSAATEFFQCSASEQVPIQEIVSEWDNALAWVHAKSPMVAALVELWCRP